MLRWLLIVGGILGTLLLIALLVLGWAWWSVKSVPIEYEKVLVVAPEIKKKSSDDFEKQATELGNDTRRAFNQWSESFTQDQINSFLSGLPQWLAERHQENPLPPEITEPRVVLSPGRVQIFARYEGAPVQTVVSLDLELALTGATNEFSVKIRSARAGTLPLPLDQLTDQVTKAARDAQIPLRWQQEGGYPVAIVTVPPDHQAFQVEVFFEKLDIREGAIFLQGRTGKTRK